MSLTSLSAQTGRYVAIALGVSIPISVAADNVLVGVILLAWLAAGGWRDRLASLRANPAALAAFGFLAFLVLGIAWSPDAREGWYYVNKHRDLVLVAVLGTLFFRPGEKQRALDAFLATMALALVVSYAIWLGILPINDPPNRYPANPAAFKLHITHGVLMALAAFLAADRALRAGDRRWRLVYTAGAALAACNVFMLHGRTGYVVFVVLAVYFAAAHWRWRGVGAAAATLAVGFAVFHSVTTAEMRETRAQRNETSSAIRLNYYRTTAAIVRDRPVLGVGTGGFQSAYREKIKGTDLPESNNPHSQYLLTAAQLGAAGLLALVALFCIMWRQARALDPAARLAARGLVLTVAVGCVFNSFLIDHVEGLLFAWMAGLLFAAPPPAK